MKKIILGIVALAAVLFVVLQIFTWYNGNNIMSNQTVFKIYMDVKDEDMDEYFGVEKGTYDKENHMIVCNLPVQPAPFKQYQQVVDFNISSIDCNEKYTKGNYVKYDQTELNDDQNATLYIINKNYSPSAGPIDSQLEGKGAGTVASRQVHLEYQMGTINHIVLAKDKVYEYCNK
ncbi:hypothetical protein [Chryseobacterium kwangjuense]|uniref:Uncharacterized protein n=1 Tax=Chryseobacterium kwangjuense TaxID=267125 RepID=A0A135WJW3_9FLAO|nr:hypothetical protein [Chryseobacterium kwangjuense]KXH85218.1 hypothetical protein AU378_05560 [Chryseobacterium kwangjuense]